MQTLGTIYPCCEYAMLEVNEHVNSQQRWMSAVCNSIQTVLKAVCNSLPSLISYTLSALVFIKHQLLVSHVQCDATHVRCLYYSCIAITLLSGHRLHV